MNYYRRYLGDYLRDTAHLSMMEHGAYTIMLDHCYGTEKPLPATLGELYRLCRAISDEEQAAVRKVASEFFKLRQDGYRNSRADREITIAQKTIEKQRNSGKISAEKRWRPVERGNGSTHKSTHKSTDGSTGRSAIQPPTTNQSLTALSGKPDRPINGHDSAEIAILSYLNQKTGRDFRPVKSNIALIAARLKDGASQEDMRGVIDRKCEQWADSEKMAQFLRPATLFNATKFAQYAGELNAPTRPKRLII